MDLKWISLAAIIIAILLLPFWPWIHGEWWPIAVGFCVFVAGLTFLVSIFGKRGGRIWHHRGQG